ncbi:MAG TPA: rod shape-determining protein MreC [Terriglobales bacterium]|jgi:rod shape-determining protein MreC
MDNLMGRYRNVSILAAAIFVQVLGLAVQVKRSSENHSSRLIRVWAVSAVTPLEKAIVRIQTGTSDLWHNYVYLRGVRQENRALKDQIEQLQLQQVRLEQDASQAHRLQALLGFKEQFIAKTLAAQVIGSSGSEQSRSVFIDKGSHDGIQQDMPVISASGIVGKVTAVFKGTSEVLLINDQQSGVGVILEQSRVIGVLHGKASGALVIDKVMADEQVKPGEKILTSGGDLIFPKGLLVGTVTEAEKGPEFLQIAVKPATALNRLEEVLVITKKEERQPSVPAPAMRVADILSRRLPFVPDKPVTPASLPAKNTVATPAAQQQQGSVHPASAEPVGLKAATTPQVTPTAVQVPRISVNPALSPAEPKRETLLTPSSKPAATVTPVMPGTKPAPKPKPVADPAQPPIGDPGGAPQ